MSLAVSVISKVMATIINIHRNKWHLDDDLAIRNIAIIMTAAMACIFAGPFKAVVRLKLSRYAVVAKIRAIMAQVSIGVVSFGPARARPWAPNPARVEQNRVTIISQMIGVTSKIGL